MASVDGFDPPAAATLDGSDEDEAVCSSADDYSESDGNAAGEQANGSGTKAKKASTHHLMPVLDNTCPVPQKKKKRKKKAGEGGAANGSPGPSAAERKAADARCAGQPLYTSCVLATTGSQPRLHRFQAAMQLLTTNDEDGMWIKLSNCFLQDAKVAKLCEAMANNTQVTSIDLSSNCLTNTAAHVLAAALTVKTNAPDLILLDVRGNSMDEEALKALVRVVVVPGESCSVWYISFYCVCCCCWKEATNVAVGEQKQLFPSRSHAAAGVCPLTTSRRACSHQAPQTTTTTTLASQRQLPGRRKDLKIECGALEEEVPEPPPSNGLPSWTQRIFQVGNDGGEEEEGQPAVDPEEMSEALWSTVGGLWVWIVGGCCLSWRVHATLVTHENAVKNAALDNATKTTPCKCCGHATISCRRFRLTKHSTASQPTSPCWVPPWLTCFLACRMKWPIARCPCCRPPPLGT